MGLMVFSNDKQFLYKVGLHFLTIDIARAHNGADQHSSHIIISDEDVDSSTESDSIIELESSWWGPENQLGLGPEELFGY